MVATGRPIALKRSWGSNSSTTNKKIIGTASSALASHDQLDGAYPIT